MTTKEQILWGKYKTKAATWEGPYFPGTQKYRAPVGPSYWDNVLEVITATEGGTYDAINMYDRMVVSVGLIQWAGPSSVAQLLGAINEGCALGPELIREHLPLKLAGVELVRGPDQRWAFMLKKGSELKAAATWQEQRQIFLGDATGLLDSWDPVSKHLARMWAVGLVNVLQHPQTQGIQRLFTLPRLINFASAKAKEYLWGTEDQPEPDVGVDSWVDMFRAAYLSFAANRPDVAEKHIVDYHRRDCRHEKWSPRWCLQGLHQMTYGPQIPIYIGRYNKIRPVLENRFGIDLPDFADDLAGSESTDLGPVVNLANVTHLQLTLLAFGYDLGHAGADGVIGPKTDNAIRAFQRHYMKQRIPDGLVGPKTTAALLTAIKETWKAPEAVDDETLHNRRG